MRCQAFAQISGKLQSEARYGVAGEGVGVPDSGRAKKDPRFHREKFCAVADFFSLAVS
jgi:hypothetical protein